MNRGLFFPSTIPSMLRDLDYFTQAGHTRTRANYSITEDANGFNLELDLPGVKKENLSISVKEDTLTIIAEKKKVEQEGNEENGSKEVVVSRFEESFTLNSKSIDLESIDAKLEDGILTVKLPKKEELKYEKRIEVR